MWDREKVCCNSECKLRKIRLKSIFVVCQIIVIKTTKCQITERTKKFIIHDLYLNQKSNPNLSVRYNRNKFTLKHVQYKLIKKTEKDETILKMNFFFWPNIYFSIKKFFSNRRTFKLYRPTEWFSYSHLLSLAWYAFGCGNFLAFYSESSRLHLALFFQKSSYSLIHSLHFTDSPGEQYRTKLFHFTDGGYDRKVY